MSGILYPTSSQDLRDKLRMAATSKRAVRIFGNDSKRLMAGAVAPADTQISTSGMNRILQYEPRDLTVSVEAGIRYTDLSRELARNGQMIPLAGPYSAESTIGGIVAANINESRRRGYGSARDLVIGMEFATLEGNLVRSGGMVVKNVAGLDMAKLMIGSFGTLAAIGTVNFKLLPIPTLSRSLLILFEDLKSAMALQRKIMEAGLNPLAADILNPALSRQFNLKGFALALQYGGNGAVIERSVRETTELCANSGIIRQLALDEEQTFWTGVADITARFLEKFREGAVVRILTPLAECAVALETVEQAGHVMAATGVVRAWFNTPDAAARWLNSSVRRGWKGVIEFAGEGIDRSGLVLWPAPGGDFEIMERIKKMFDPESLLNRGRLYGLL